MYHPVHTLTIETNGTIRPPKSLSLNSDVKWSVSPKMDWFNPEYPLGEFEANVDAFHAVRGELWWKFAVRLSGYDVAYVKRFVEQYKLRGTIVLQLMNEQLDGDVDKDEYLSKLRNLAEMVATRHHFTRFRVLPQLHVLLWGGRKGV
jgi:organic radical activating enzyme